MEHTLREIYNNTVRSLAENLQRYDSKNKEEGSRAIEIAHDDAKKELNEMSNTDFIEALIMHGEE